MISRRNLLVSLLPLLHARRFEAAPQPQNTEDNPPLFHAETSLVLFDVTVTDGKKNLVERLQKEDFLVYEDGLEQEIAFFSHETRPVSWGIVLDRSGSMMGMMEEVVNAALHSIDAGTPKDDIFIIAFDDIIETIQEFTTDRERLRAASRKIRARGMTALYDAVAEGLDHVRRGKHQKKVLVVVTDGDDNASIIRFPNLLRLARENESLIYTVGFFGELAAFMLRYVDPFRNTQQELRQLAEETGGLAYFPKDMNECDQVCRDIALQVSRQYSLGYYPKNRSYDGGWRQIVVDVRHTPGVDVRARKGYFASAAAWAPTEAAFE